MLQKSNQTQGSLTGGHPKKKGDCPNLLQLWARKAERGERSAHEFKNERGDLLLHFTASPLKLKIHFAKFLPATTWLQLVGFSARVDAQGEKCLNLPRVDVQEVCDSQENQRAEARGQPGSAAGGADQTRDKLSVIKLSVTKSFILLANLASFLINEEFILENMLNKTLEGF